ncbi:MAG: hypothetical protein ACXVBJ_15945 [Flavisolibacter sp.]
MKIRLLFFSCFCFLLAHSQDSPCIKVQFIYGSKPLKKYKETEKKWFGGIHGGHVGIEGDSGKFYSFEIAGKNKLIGGKPDNCAYRCVTSEHFWSIMKTREDSIKFATITIPLTASQKHKLDSITTAYMLRVPYSYAVFGMRCAASTYEILAQIGILPEYSPLKTSMKIFYPRRLRKRLLRKAEKNNWMVTRKEGTPKRKWEKDV